MNYICPVEGAQGGDRRRSTPSSPTNPLIFPSEETLAKVKIFDAEAADNQELKENSRRYRRVSRDGAALLTEPLG